jgi:hypothetical protein
VAAQPAEVAGVFPVMRYRSQWGHLPLAFLPFLAAVGVVLGLKAAGPAVPEAVSTGVLGVVGLAFAVAILAMPRLWGAWRARGRCELQVADGAVRLVEAGTGRLLGTCPATPTHVAPAEFHYTVTARFGGGTFRAPAIVLRFEGGGSASIGVQGSPLEWDGAVEPLRRPAWVMDAGFLPAFAALVGLGDRLVAVADARVR